MTAEPATPARRATKQRTAIAAVLRESDAFRSAQDIHALLHEAGHRVGLATVYRTVTALAADGELDVVRSEDGETRYRSCTTTDHHHHLLCRRCGATVEIDGPEVERWAAAIAREHGFTDVDHTIEIVGLCPACSAAEG